MLWDGMAHTAERGDGGGRPGERGLGGRGRRDGAKRKPKPLSGQSNTAKSHGCLLIPLHMKTTGIQTHRQDSHQEVWTLRDRKKIDELKEMDGATERGRSGLGGRSGMSEPSQQTSG